MRSGHTPDHPVTLTPGPGVGLFACHPAPMGVYWSKRSEKPVRIRDSSQHYCQRLRLSPARRAQRGVPTATGTLEAPGKAGCSGLTPRSQETWRATYARLSVRKAAVSDGLSSSLPAEGPKPDQAHPAGSQPGGAFLCRLSGRTRKEGTAHATTTRLVCESCREGGIKRLL
jgi:hypothetical protein